MPAKPSILLPTPLLPSSPTASRVRWLLTLPKLGVILLVLSMLLLFWLLHLSEQEEERMTLIKDVLWLEQNIRFHMDGNEAQLQQLAVDLSQHNNKRTQFQTRAEHLLKNSQELHQIAWLDRRGQIVLSTPSTPLPTSKLPSHSLVPPPREDAHSRGLEIAAKLGRQAYSEAFVASGSNAAYFELITPIFNNQKYAGALVAVYPLDALLTQLVPWWFAEKYQVAIVDDNDTSYAVKSQIQGSPGQGYEIPFDPPGYGLKLKVTAYQQHINPLQKTLAGAIFLLAIGVLWSLWAVRRLMRKRLQVEEALRAEHAFRKAMEDSLTVGMRARDNKGKIIYVNPAFCRMTGFANEELVGRLPPMPYWVPEQMEETYAIHRAVLAGEAPQDGFEITFMRKNGERFQALIYEAPLIDGQGNRTGWMGSVLDITERKRAEELVRQQHEQLQFTSRLVTLGEMASTLAHELNQPLAAIASYNAGCLNLLTQENLHPRDLKEAMEKLGTQAQRAGKIIRRVHDFVRKSEPKRAPCVLEEVIEDCLGFIEPDLRRHHVRLEKHIGPLPEIYADRLMLEQVLLNLIRNGIEAMSGTPPEFAVLSLRIEAQEHEVVVQIIDNGCGISEDSRQKLFTAFFTTKPEGMGVGLSICRSIIEFHRGRIWAEANPDSPTGTGTLFTFTLSLEAP